MIKRKLIVPTTRSKRPINIVHSLIPLEQGKIENAIIHKHAAGGLLLIGLNEYNEPVRVFTDIQGVIPIKSVSKDLNTLYQTNSHLRPIKQVKTIYFNHGSLLDSIHFQQKHYYSDDLMTLLSKIKLQKRPASPTKKIPSFKEVSKLIKDLTF